MADFDPTTAKPLDFDPDTATPIKPRGMISAFGAGAGETAAGVAEAAGRVTGATGLEKWGKEKAAGFAPTEEETLPVHAARALGGMAAYLPAIIGTAAALPEVTVGGGLMALGLNAVRGYAAMTIPMAVQKINRTADLKEQGVDSATAEKAGWAEAATTGLMGVVPLSKAGSLATRAATGAGSQVAVTEIARHAQNIALSDYPELQSEFSAKELATSGVVGAFMGGVLGPRPIKTAIAQAHADATADIEAGAPIEKAPEQGPIEFTKPEPAPPVTLAEPGARLSPETPGGMPFIKYHTPEQTAERVRQIDQETQVAAGLKKTEGMGWEWTPPTKKEIEQGTALAPQQLALVPKLSDKRQMLENIADTVKEEGAPKLTKQLIAQISQGGESIGELAAKLRTKAEELAVSGKEKDTSNAGTLQAMAEYLNPQEVRFEKEAPSAIRQPSPTRQIPRAVERGENIPEGGVGVRPGEQGTALAQEGGEGGHAPSTEKTPLIEQRAIVEPPGTPRERRIGAEEVRARFEAMTPEERTNALIQLHQEQRTNPLTGLPNKRAYAESEKLPVQIFADIDNLKKINDTLGHDAGDAAIKAMGEAIAKETGQVYHISGDEFHIQAKSKAAAHRAMRAARSALAEKGFGFSYGLGKDIKAAEKDAYVDKQKRKEKGLRSERAGLDFTAPAKGKTPVAEIAPIVAEKAPTEPKIKISKAKLKNARELSLKSDSPEILAIRNAHRKELGLEPFKATEQPAIPETPLAKSRREWRVQAGSTIMAEIRKSSGLGENIPKAKTEDPVFEAKLQAARDQYARSGEPGDFRKVTEIIEQGPHFEAEPPGHADEDMLAANRVNQVSDRDQQLERDQQVHLLQDKYGGSREEAIQRFMGGERIDPNTGETAEHIAYEDEHWNIFQNSLNLRFSTGQIATKTLGDALDIAKTHIPKGKKFDFLRNTIDALALNKRVRDAGFSLTGKTKNTISGGSQLGLYFPGEHRVEMNNGGGMRSFLHEAIHAALHAEYRADPNFKRNMDRLFEAARLKATSEEIKTHYGLKNVQEFMSETYADPEFQQFLKAVKFRGEPVIVRFIHMVKGFLTRLVGKEDTASLLHDVVRLSEARVSGAKTRVAKGVPVTEESLAAEKIARVVDFQAGPRQAATAVDNILVKTVGMWDGVVKPALLRTHLHWAQMTHIADVTEHLIPKLSSWAEDTQNPIREKIDSLLKSGAMAVKLNHQTRQIVDSMTRLQPKQQEALFSLMGKYQLAKVYPNKSLEEHVWLKPGEHQLYREAKQLYNQPGVKAAYDTARLHNQTLHDSGMAAMIKSMGHIYGAPEEIWSKIDALDGMGKNVQALRDWVTKSGDGDLQEQFKTAMALHEAKKTESYFHIGRDGDFMVRAAIKNTPEAKVALQAALVAAGVKDKIVINDSDLRFFSKFETYNEMLAVTKQMDALASAGHLQDEYTSGKVVDKLKALDSSAPSFIRGMLAKIDADPHLDAADKTQQQEMLRRLYIDMLPESSVSKYYARRSGTPGYSADMIRSYAKRASGAAYFVAQNATRGEQAAAMARLREATTEFGASGSPHFDLAKQQYATDVVNELNQRTANILTPLNTPAIDKLSSFGHTFFLSASPGFILQNLAQPYQLTLPYLGGRHGFRATAVAMGSAGKDALAMMKDAIQEGYKDGKWTGILDATITTARSKMSEVDKRAANILITTGRVDFTQASGLSNVMAGAGEVASALDRTKQTANLLSQQGEILNRMQTGLAAFRLEMKRNGGDEIKAHEYMTKAVDDTQINYATENRARAIGKQGVFGAVTPLVLAFQQYNMGVIQLLGKLTLQAMQNASPGARAEAVKSLAGIMATTGVLAGTMGLPFAGVIMGAYNAFAGDNDHPVDAKTDYQNFLSDIVGQDAAQIIAHGAANYLTGADVAAKMGQENVIPFTQLASQMMDDRTALKDRINSGMLQFAGPVVGAGANITQGIGKMADGQLMKGAEQMFPSALRGAAKAVDAANNGFTDSKGNQLPLEATTWDAVTQSLGFTPTKLATQREAQRGVSQIQNALKLRAEVLEAKFVEAVESHDMEARREALDAITAFRKANPTVQINLGQMLQRRAKERAIGATTGVMGKARQIPLIQQQTRYVPEFKPQQSLLSQ